MKTAKSILYVKGNPEKIISLCTGISEEEKKRISDLMEEFQSKAGRLLAFAHKELEGQYNDEEQDEVEQGPDLRWICGNLRPAESRCI